MERYQAAALHLAYLIVGDAQDAEDVTQEALIKAHAAMAHFRADAPFRPWLLQIVANEARNRRRSVGRRAHMSARAAADQQIAADTAAPSPESLVLALEERHALLKAVDALHDADRLAIAGRYFMDLSEAETADLLGCARGTVKSRVSRGLARLRERLQAREFLALIVAALLVLGAGLAAWPEARTAIAERLGLRGVSLRHVSELPAVRPVGPSLDLGQPVSLDQASALLGARVLLPAGLGQPLAVYAANGQVWVVYSPRDGLPVVADAGGVGLLVTELNATLDREVLLGKSIPRGTSVESVLVQGSPGYWIAGAPHLYLRLSGDRYGDVPARLAGNTLLWEQAGLTLRIESGLDRDAALSIAGTFDGTD